jgi:uncharacterized protein
VFARALGAIAALAFALAAPAQEHPKLDAPVTDRTGTLTPAQVAALRAKIDALEARKGSQIVVLVVPSTQPETIEEYAVATFEQNAIGRKGVDDGVLLLVAKDDRRVRIETGYGLEGAVPDAVANRVIAEYLAPKFRAGDLHGGIDDAVTALAKVIEGEALPAPLSRPRETARAGGVPEAVFFGGIIGIVLGGFLGAVRAGRRAPIVAAIAAIVLFMKFLVLPAAIGTGAAAITSVLGGSRGRFAGGGRAWRGSGGWGGGGWGGGGGFGGGGGWSGGGGRSGGGGASGGW